MTRAIRDRELASHPAPRLLDARLLRGRNVHFERSVFVQRVDLGELAGLRSVELGPLFATAIVSRFGNLDGGFLAKLYCVKGATPERVLLEAIMGLERTVACTMQRLDPVVHASVRQAERPGIVELAWECHSSRISRAAVALALMGLLESIRDPGAPPSPTFVRRAARLRRRAARKSWPAATAALIQRARRRNIACEPMANAYLRLGEGSMQHVVSGPAVASGAVNLDELFAPDAPCALPTALIVGHRGAAALARDLEGLLRAVGVTAALATRRESMVGGRPVAPTSQGRPGELSFMLRDPRVDALVHAVSPRRIIRNGLRMNRCLATAVVDVPESTAQRDAGVDVAVAATERLVVVATDHPLAPGIAAARHPSGLMLVATLPRDLAAHRHLAQGGWATLVHTSAEGEELRIQRGDRVVLSVRLPGAGLPDPDDGAGVRTLMQAMALAYALGLSETEVATAVTRLRHLRGRKGR